MDEGGGRAAFWKKLLTSGRLDCIRIKWTSRRVRKGDGKNAVSRLTGFQIFQTS